MAEEKKHEAGHENHEQADKPEKPKASKIIKWLLPALGVILALLFAAGGYIYAVSPEPIRNPKMEHLHFRMQLIVDGKDVDFSQSDFQTPYAKGQCSADLSNEPFHFHDGKKQFVHVHWAGMDGGLLLKNYGWNFVGGKPDVLGYRADDLPRLKAVPIHGKALPDVPEGTAFWVYTGDENGYQKKSFDDFKAQGFEQFFGKDSNFPKSSRANSGITGWFFPVASAHGSENHDAVLSVGDENEEERLTRMHNLLGNVVIFVQKSEPSDEQIKARFADLEPLSDSTCGG